MYSHGFPRRGRDSIFTRFRSRSASALRARNSAPGMLRVENTSDVFQGRPRIRLPRGFRSVRLQQKKSREILAVVFDLALQNARRHRSVAASSDAMAAAPSGRSSITIFTLPAVS